MMTDMNDLVYRARVRGCLLGGALGDALGGPVEFWDGTRIARECGGAVTQFLPELEGDGPTYGGVTDDTQMTLFTVEGMIRASVRTDRGLGLTVAVLHHAYDRWLDTQLQPGPDGTRDGWLITQQWLYAPRAPGNTCISSLVSARGGHRSAQQFGAHADNQSKGCGTVMRSAPFGLTPPDGLYSLEWQFDAAAQAASFTHGHPTAQLAAGALAVLIAAIVAGQDLPDAVATMTEHLCRHAHHEETSRAIERAVAAADGAPSEEVLESLGGGWVAEEALAIAIYAALSYPDPDSFTDALSLAVSHSGDSDSTGAICGNILGALHGEAALPPELAFEIEGRGTILEHADDFIYEFTSAGRLHGDHDPDTRWTSRYPGW